MSIISFTKLNLSEIDNEESPFDPYSELKISLFGKPIEIGHFSIDSNKQIYFDRSQMKYLITNLRRENLDYDLNAGYSSNTIHQYVTLQKLHQLLHWIVKKNFLILKSKIDFVTVRGTLSRIMCAPYMKGFYKSQWIICATKFRGVIYLSAIDTDIDAIDYVTPQLMRYQSWGYKFEQYITAYHQNEKPVLRPINNHEEFCIVLLNGLNQFKLLYQAEIDAAIPHPVSKPGSGDTSCYVELKTSQVMIKPTDIHKFYSQKIASWWAQSYLTGISDIICGRRTPEGIVKFLECYCVKNIQKNGLWSSEACLNFCDKFLKLVKKTVIEDNPNIAYTFTNKGEGVIFLEKLVNPEAKLKIIPDWYQDAIRKMQ